MLNKVFLPRGALMMEVSFSLDNEELAKSYDEMSNSQFENGIKLIEGIGIKAGDKVLDIGSGTGRLGSYVANIISSTGSIIGIDPLEKRVKIANDKNQYSNAAYIPGTAEDLSFIPDNSISVVYLNAVFHWINDKEKALKEIFRVLQPGGKIGIATIPRECINYCDIAILIGDIFRKEDYCDFFNSSDAQYKKYIVTTTDLIVMLQKAGFFISNVQVVTNVWKFKTGKETLKHMDSSSFGNLFGFFTGNIKEQVKSEVEDALEKYISNGGSCSKWYGLTAFAYKRT